MKRIITLITAVAMISALSVAFAADTASTTDQQNTNLDIYKTNESIAINKPAEAGSVLLWKKLKSSGYMGVDNDGFMTIHDGACQLANCEEDYAAVLRNVDFANEQIGLGLLVMNPKTLEPENVKLTEENIKIIGNNILNKTENKGLDELNSELRIDPHTCNYKKVNVGKITYDNWEEIRTFYHKELALSQYVAGINPQAATTGYWIGCVGSGCKWDYKVTAEYGPYNRVLCCSYAGRTHVHQTAEWLGNYNYGYTGRLLFGLNTLYFGSSAVSGFSAKDREDWPAIKEGYDNSSDMS